MLYWLVYYDYLYFTLFITYFCDYCIFMGANNAMGQCAGTIYNFIHYISAYLFIYLCFYEDEFNMIILNEKIVSIVADYTWGFTFLTFIGIIIGLLSIGVFIFILSNKTDADIFQKCISGFLVLALLLLCIWIVIMPTKPITKEIKELTVAFNDTYPINEVYRNYDIIEVNGLEFIIREKIKDTHY